VKLSVNACQFKISLRLGFFMDEQNNDKHHFICKIHAISDGYILYGEDIKDIKLLNQIEGEEYYSKSPKKLCNCGINYIKYYYIICILLLNNSSSYMPHCVINRECGSIERRGMIDYIYLTKSTT
jgi:hypothetical protein